jgi:flagella basal body P-ring formation protein FlgA
MTRILGARQSNQTANKGQKPGFIQPLTTLRWPGKLCVKEAMNTQFAISALLLALTASAAAATQTEDAARLRQLATSHLAQQTAGMPGEISINVELPKPAAKFTRCEAPEAFIPEGARLVGSVTVGIRCHAPANWTTYVRASVSVAAHYLVAAAPLKLGQTLTADLLETRHGDLGKLAQDVITQPELAIGKVMTTGLVAGSPLRAAMLRDPQAVAQGQGIQLVVNGKGFSISSEGRALNNAAVGQVVQVRTASGQVVSGIARSGGLVDIAN